MELKYFRFIESEQQTLSAFDSQYDLLLVGLSILTAIFACYTAFLVYERIHASDKATHNYVWRLAGALAFGGGVWAMHFVGMLAYQLPIIVSYDTQTTILSALPAILAGFVVLSRKRKDSSITKLLAHSVLMGSSIGAMHYIGMTGMRTNAIMLYDPQLFALSIIIAVCLSLLSLSIKRWALLKSTKTINPKTVILLASIAMGIAISSMHYMGMAAVNFIPSADLLNETPTMDITTLALTIGLVICTLFIFLITAVFFSRQNALLIELDSSHKRLQKIFDSTADALIVINDKGIIEAFNPEAERIFGYTQEEAINQPVNMLMPEHDKQHHDQYIKKHVATGQRKVLGLERELQGIRKDGSTFPMQLAVNNADIHGNRQFIGVIRDITLRKEEESELKLHRDHLSEMVDQRTLDLSAARDEAEKANLAKSEFLANMSHEIRTPMNGVIGMTNLLIDSSLDQEQFGRAMIIKQSAESLLGIINDILDFSKIEAGKLDLEPMKFDLGDLMEDFAATMSLRAEEKGLELICPASPTIHRWYIGDPGRIRQIITNLVGNAIKFTASGEVCVRYVVEEDSAKNSCLCFTITDTGIGLSEPEQKKLFNRFSQADGSTTRKYGGTGLGLAISKQLVEMMEGSINVTSVPGEGSTFRFTITLEKVDAPSSSSIIPSNDLYQQKILVVDDNQTNLMVLDEQLTAWRIEHATASCGDAALQILYDATAQEKPFTIAIIDMQMPEMDGVQLGNLMREDKRLTATRRVLFSSQGQRGDAKVAQEAGFSAYLNKPINQLEFYNALLKVAGISQNNETLITRHTAKTQQYHARILIVEDNATNQMVAKGILKKFGMSADVAGNGEEAISALTQLPYDLVFMDCQMPVMDGYDATREIRNPTSSVMNHDIPIIAMTANAMKGDREQCLDAGMNDYIPKPINPTALQQALEQWLPESCISDIAEE